MLQFGSKTFEVDGVTVLQDHAVETLWWCLPTRVTLDKRPDGSAAISMQKWKNADTEAVAKGGGFLQLQTVVELPPQTRARILSKAAALSPSGTPTLAVAPVEGGTVRCVALNLEGSGGTSATPPPAGAFNAVTKILGAVKPSLTGNETAAFSLVLDKEGATILEKAFNAGQAPVGVVYDLEYSGMTPDLHVIVTAEFERTYNHFSAGLEAQIYWFKIGIDAAFEKLVQDGAIKIEVVDSDPSDPTHEAKQKFALDLFKNDLLKQWFEPSLNLGQIAGGAAQPEGLDAVLKRAKDMLGKGGQEKKTDEKKAEDKKTEDKKTEDKKTEDKKTEDKKTEDKKTEDKKTEDKKTDGAKPDDKKAESEKPAEPAPLPAATLKITEISPNPLPEGFGLALVAGSKGPSETLEVKGRPGALITVDKKPLMLDASGKATVDVPPGSSFPVTVDWAASPPVDETFNLFFTFDQPKEKGFVASPSNPVFASYLLNAPTPPDARFSQSTAPGKTAPPAGAVALQEWLEKRLIAPKSVTLTAHASFEGKTDSDSVTLNDKLSRRRLDIAKGIIGNRATFATEPQALGFSRARSAARIRDEKDRVAEITGKVPGKDPAVAIRATLAREKPAVTPTPTPTPTPNPTPTPTPTPSTDATPTGGADGGTPALVSFKLKFLHQEERKNLRIEYNSKKAVKRTYAPQGFIGLLLDELPDKAKHFIEIDLDDPFFRELGVDIATPADFQKIGLFSTDISIDYGDPADPQNHRHQEFRLTATEPGPKRFETFLNEKREISFRAGFQHHFDANSGWIGEKLTYEIPPRETLDRTLNVDPANDLGFLELQIFPNRIDSGIVEAIDVALSYDDAATFKRSDTFRVLPRSVPQFWRLRLTNPERRQWTATFTHHLKNGATRTSGPVTSDASFLPVDDPFVDVLDIRAIPLFQAGTVRRAFVDIEYEDKANAYRREERIEMLGDAVDPVAVRIALLDPAQDQFRHRVTIVTASGALISNPPVDGRETLIGVGQEL